MDVLPRAQHVWVSLTGTWGDMAEPGVLLAWRRHPRNGWQAWVIVVRQGIGAHGDGPYVTQSWVPATSVQRLEARPPSGGPTA